MFEQELADLGSASSAVRVDFALYDGIIVTSSSVYGLLIEDIKKVEGPCQSLSLRTDTKGKSDQSAVEQLSPMFGAH